MNHAVKLGSVNTQLIHIRFFVWTELHVVEINFRPKRPHIKCYAFFKQTSCFVSIWHRLLQQTCTQRTSLLLSRYLLKTHHCSIFGGDLFAWVRCDVLPRFSFFD